MLLIEARAVLASVGRALGEVSRRDWDMASGRSGWVSSSSGGEEVDEGGRESSLPVIGLVVRIGRAVVGGVRGGRSWDSDSGEEGLKEEVRRLCLEGGDDIVVVRHGMLGQEVASCERAC